MPYAFAQQTRAVCAADPAFRAFDFWIGAWRVIDQTTGNHAGTNIIKSVEAGCALQENWRNTAGITGRSINYYNPITKKWRQLWVAAGAYSIDIEGTFHNGSMQLEGTIAYYGTLQSFPFKGRWTPILDGSVRQYFEQYDPSQQQWQPWFDGLYTKENNPKL